MQPDDLPVISEQEDPARIFSMKAEQGPEWRRWVPKGQTRGKRIKEARRKYKRACQVAVMLIDKIRAEVAKSE